MRCWAAQDGEQRCRAAFLDPAKVGRKQVVGDEHALRIGRRSRRRTLRQQPAQDLPFDVAQIVDAADEQGVTGLLQCGALPVQRAVPGKGGAVAGGKAGGSVVQEFRIVAEDAVGCENVGLFVFSAPAGVGHGRVDFAARRLQGRLERLALGRFAGTRFRNRSGVAS